MNKFVCTMGPSILELETLKELALNGMSAVRFNMSHIDYNIENILEKIKILNNGYGYNVLTYMDLKGSSIRVIINENMDLKYNQKVIIGEDFYINFNDLSCLNKNDKIYINDGQIILNIEEIKDNRIICTVIIGGLLKNEHGFYQENLNSQIPFLSTADINDIKLAVKLNMDYLILSFVNKKEDIEQIKKIINESNSSIKIISKIETKKAVENIDEIISVSDAILIGRGDLGVAFSIYEIPSLQKYISMKVKAADKKLIIGTGFLKSMKKQLIPERAEVTDLYNAFLDGADEIMFSGETAISKDPIIVLKAANKILKTLENYFMILMIISIPIFILS